MRKQKSLARGLRSRRSLDPIAKRGRLFPELAPGPHASRSARPAQMGQPESRPCSPNHRRPPATALGRHGGGGLNQLAPDTGRFTHHRHDPRDSNSLSSDIIRHINEDETGTLWIGTDGGGINQFDPDGGTSKRSGAPSHQSSRISLDLYRCQLQGTNGSFCPLRDGPRVSSRGRRSAERSRACGGCGDRTTAGSVGTIGGRAGGFL